MGNNNSNSPVVGVGFGFMFFLSVLAVCGTLLLINYQTPNRLVVEQVVRQPDRPAVTTGNVGQIGEIGSAESSE